MVVKSQTVHFFTSRILNEQRSDRNNVTRRRGHLRTRGRSLEMVDTQSVSANTRGFASSSHRRYTHQHHHQPPPTPMPLEIRNHGNRRRSYQNLSRSDSRLNQERLNAGNDDEGSVSSYVTGTGRRVPRCDISSSRSSYTSCSGSGSFSKPESSRSSSLSSVDLLEAARTSVSTHRTFAVTPLSRLIHRRGKRNGKEQRDLAMGSAMTDSYFLNPKSIRRCTFTRAVKEALSKSDASNEDNILKYAISTIQSYCIRFKITGILALKLLQQQNSDADDSAKASLSFL
ncbi:hypothetical protein ACTXT7_011271 [Hymenolepis weldensis]